MSRRAIFLLAAAAIMLYFCMILCMLSPLQGVKGNNYMHRLSLRNVPMVRWCKELRWRVPPSPDVVALVSYPGSGNTWLRYLLQQLTGIVTGSMYMDYGLRMHGFPAENFTNGSVLVVKTHEPPPLQADRFKSAILLIRNPRDAILADFNRLHKGHVGTAPKAAFRDNVHERLSSDWAGYVTTQLVVWEALHQLWLTRFSGPVHIVFYEVLVRDTRRTLNGILDFIGYNVTEEDMNCALAYREGIYRRKKKHEDFDPFTPDMYNALDVVKRKVLNLVNDYNKRH